MQDQQAGLSVNTRTEASPSGVNPAVATQAARRRARQAIILVALLAAAALLDDGLIGTGVTLPLIFAIPILAGALMAGGRFILPIVGLAAAAHALLVQRWA